MPVALCREGTVSHANLLAFYRSKATSEIPFRLRVMYIIYPEGY